MDGKLNVAVGQCPAELVGPQARYDWLKKTLDNIDGQRLDLLILPELFLTGYNVGERLIEWGEAQEGPFAGRIAKLAEQNRVAIHYGFAEKDGSQLYNTSLCIDGDGKCIGKHQKLLFPPGFENRYFVSGSRCTLFSMGGFNIATLICYDAEFPEACRHVVAMGADLIIMPSVLSEHWVLFPKKWFQRAPLKTAYLFVTLTSAERKMDGLILAAVVLSPRRRRIGTRRRN